MSLKNRATVIENLGQNPQLSYTPQGDTGVHAQRGGYAIGGSLNKQTNERRLAVEWHHVVVWGRPDSICVEKLAKGHQLYVEGKLAPGSSDEDGEKRR